MSTEVIETEELEMDALTLMDFLNKTIGEDESLVAVYVQDDTGRTFERVTLVRETLTDGSEVFNLVLS
ncbi:hypothetical protein [Sinorhizobium meliloti]|uniref:hypothetical protein n=1 Tax=Rhizobium meliloti TaxID=382 RepID=UPI0012970C94|nr:hypothetical protein [Sinorhizobium meliloti]MDW9491711.1 hypothetical protein [Sinorhizobium meliloti]MQV02977.1 hypothetical protein [Sinorhizobium meliloti]